MAAGLSAALAPKPFHLFLTSSDLSPQPRTPFLFPLSIFQNSRIQRNQTNQINISTRTHRGRIQPNAKGFPGNSPARNREPAAKKLPGQTNGGDGGGEDEIPETVANRIVTRILTFVGVPLGLGVTLLKIFEWIKENNVWEVPIWVPFLTTFLTFGASALGIAYGTLSASLDPGEEGSLFGWEQAEKNWVEMWKEEDEANR